MKGKGLFSPGMLILRGIQVMLNIEPADFICINSQERKLVETEDASVDIFCLTMEIH